MLLEKPKEWEFYVSQAEQPTFSHPMEAEFARILDYYGIEWHYEPRTFVLGRDAEGNVTEAFSPDFYLPSEDLYVELTTMRPALVSRKNRKLKRLRALFPEVNVKLLKRDDLRNLMIKFGKDGQAAPFMGTDAQEMP